MGTTALYPNTSADVWPGGQITFAVVFESYVGSRIGVNTTGVTVGITASNAADSGSGTPVATTSTGVVSQGTGLYQYVWHVGTTVAPGSYLVTWTGTRTSDNTLVSYSQAVTVAAQPSPAPLPGLYATVAQYRNKTGDQFTPDATVQRRLQLASEQLDLALIGAVYAVDGDGMPTDPGLVDTLVRACCEQVLFLNAHNDDAQVKREYASTNVGGVSVTRSAAMQARALPPLGPQALAILRVSGVLPSAPLINW